MRKIGIILLLLSGFSCNPYQPYYFTHYHITAEYDPASGHLSANVRMVFVPVKEYRDSITLALNEHLEIRSLAAQELRYYEFYSGRLVLYIEEVVMPGDQLHISLAYEGRIAGEGGREAGMIPENGWYPANRDINKMTYRVEMVLPDHVGLELPAIGNGSRWEFDSVKPQDFISVSALVNKGKNP